jgi:hypothetical protein
MKKIICLFLFCFLGIVVSASPWWILSYVNHTQNISYVAPMGLPSIVVPANIGDSVSLSVADDCLWLGLWRFNGDIIPGPLLTPSPHTLNTVVTQSGSFVLDPCFCPVPYTFILNINTTGISSIKEITFLNIFPTTVTSSITIQLHSIKSNDIEISFYDMTGKQLKSDFYKNVFGEFIRNENTEVLAKGIYFLRIRSGDDVVQKKFVKM